MNPFTPALYWRRRRLLSASALVTRLGLVVVLTMAGCHHEPAGPAPCIAGTTCDTGDPCTTGEVLCDAADQAHCIAIDRLEDCPAE